MNELETVSRRSHWKGTLVIISLSALSIAGSPAMARAEQFVISGGHALADDSSASLVLRGPDFRLSLFAETIGELSNLGTLFCSSPCDPGSVQFSGTLSGLLGSGSARIGGVDYTDLTFRGSLDFVAGASPASGASELGTVVSGPFGFSALLTGVQGEADVFTHTLVGTGKAQLRILADVPESVRLTFDEPAPVPEPASWILLTTGMAAMAAGRRRKQRRNG